MSQLRNIHIAKALRRCSCVIILVALAACTMSTRRVMDAKERGVYERTLAVSVLFLRSEQYLEAQSGFELLLELDERDPRGWDGLASIALRKGELERAEKFLERAIACDPEYDYALAHFGLVQELQGIEEQAEDFYRRALRKNPLNQLARQGLMRVAPNAAGITAQYKMEFIKAVQE